MTSDLQVQVLAGQVATTTAFGPARRPVGLEAAAADSARDSDSGGGAAALPVGRGYGHGIRHVPGCRTGTQPG